MTAPIPVIDGEVDECAWCSIRLHANGLPPVRVHGRRFHTVCVQAYAADLTEPPVRATTNRGVSSPLEGPR